jgi:hypothetical protein
MVPVKATVDMDLIRRVRKKVLGEFEKSREVIETDEFGIEVSLALSDEKVEKLVMLALKEAKKPISWREFKQIFAGIVGEDRLRRILANLKARDVIVELTRTRYSLPEYVPPSVLPALRCSVAC